MLAGRRTRRRATVTPGSAAQPPRRDAGPFSRAQHADCGTLSQDRSNGGPAAQGGGEQEEAERSQRREAGLRGFGARGPGASLPERRLGGPSFGRAGI